MGSEVVEAIAALVVGLALIWLVLQPIVAPSPQAPEAYEPPDPEETPRGRALLALKEIEFDRATGKLSDDDYTMLHNRYSARALAVLDDVVEQDGDAPARTPAAGEATCATCGGATVPHAAFCGACGTSLSAGIPSRTTL